MKILKLIGHLVFILFLTALTQVGGLIWLITILISVTYNKRKCVLFPIIYLFFNLVVIPPIASFTGRERLPWFDKNLKPRNWFYPLAFRNYVKPRLKNELEDSAQILSLSNIAITYLDANFPFFDGCPLLPHLSHSDGKKIDISLMYLSTEGKSSDKKPSISGYGAYAKSENNYSCQSCLDKGYWQYDFSKYLTFGIINDLKLDKDKTAHLIRQLLTIPETQKLFIEPHLKQSLGLRNEIKIRFHGCKAVRHDDHIHLQIK